MTNYKNNIPDSNDNEIQELLRMLDHMEQRNLGEDIEETIRQYGYGEMSSHAYVPLEKAPYAGSSDLDQLLIAPGDDMEEAGNETLMQASQLLGDATAEDTIEDMPPPPELRRNPLQVLGGFFADNFPRRGDEPRTLARKYGFWTSLVTLISAVVFLIISIGVQPQMNAQLNNELVNLYHPDDNTVITDSTEYPNGMLASFKSLYKRNSEVSGWLSFHSNGSNDFLNIEYPVMYSGDNIKYARVDFDQKKNKNGCLFLDSRNEITGYDGMDQSIIIYGHNMASGQMFAGLNQFIGSESNARSATTFTFSSLYRVEQYVVFAVCLSDEAEANKSTYFNYWRTQFQDGDQFLSFIQQVRDRSLFDYPTDVRDDDSIVILGSCTGRTSAKLTDGRVLVFARRMRANETPISPTAITKNIDVIMPYNWYINQKMDPHSHYDVSMHGAGSTTSSTTTTTDTDVDPDTNTETGTGTDTTVVNGTDTTVLSDGTSTTTDSTGDTSDPTSDLDGSTTTNVVDPTSDATSVPTSAVTSEDTATAPDTTTTTTISDTTTDPEDDDYTLSEE